MSKHHPRPSLEDIRRAKVTGEIASLKSALSEYRAIVEKLMDKEEILALSSTARRATQAQNA